MALISQAIASSLAVGAIYALIALGFSLILGTLKVVDFAYGSYVVFGAYVTYWSSTAFFTGGSVMDAGLSIGLAAVASTLLGAFVWGVALRSLLETTHLIQLVATLGISVIIGGALLSVFGTGIVLTKFQSAQAILHIGSIYLGGGRIAAGVVGLGVLAAAVWMLSTRVGLMIRAVSLDAKGAALTGIDVRRIRVITVAVGAGLGGLAGGLLVLFLPIAPVDSMKFLLIAFFTVAIGGLDSLRGAFLAAFLVAFLEGISQNFMPNIVKNAVPYFVVFAFVALLPQGIGHIAFLSRSRR